MKNLKHSLLKFNAKVLMVFENKNNAVSHNNLSDPTITTITTITGTGIVFRDSKETNYRKG